VLANLLAYISRQIGNIKVSWEEGLASDHIALLFSIYPTNSIALILALASRGYKMDPKCHNKWTAEFLKQLMCILAAPPRIENNVKALMVLVMALDSTIEEACKKMLKLKQAPDVKATEGLLVWDM